MNIMNLFRKGVAAEKLVRSEREIQLKGMLRGGNSGYLVNGEVRGNCAREAVMRYFGVDKSFPISRSIMFGAGELMEDLLMDKFKLATDLKVLTQDECSIEWDCNGTPVKCSPDIVFADESGTPQQGIEVKMISSIWTLRDVAPFSFIPGKPKAPHLAQAGHYMRKLGEMHGEDFIPWSIVYICPVDFHAHTKDLRESKSQSEFLKRQDYGKREVFKVESSITVYELTFDSQGTLMYRLESDGRAQDTFKPTDITVYGIEDYYKLIDDCIKTKRLPPRMVNTDCNGKKLKWSRYDPKYNDYAQLHDLYDNGTISFDEFITKANDI